MKSIYLLIPGVLLLATLLMNIEAKHGKKGRGNAGKNNETSTECLGEILNGQKLNFGFNECMEEIAPLVIPDGAPDDIKKRAMKGRKKALKKGHMCVKLCQRKRQGILDQSGSFSTTGSDKFVDDVFPVKARARMQRGMLRCAEDNAEKFEIGENCKEYRRFEKCLMRMQGKSCGQKNGKQKGNRRGKQGKRVNKGKKNPEHESSDEIHEDEEEDF